MGYTTIVDLSNIISKIRKELVPTGSRQIQWDSKDPGNILRNIVINKKFKYFNRTVKPKIAFKKEIRLIYSP